MGIVENIITDNLPIWSSAIQSKSSAGRGASSKRNLYGVKKLRELILDLAIRGLLVPQDPSDEPASVLLEKIAAEKEQLIKDSKLKKQKLVTPLKGSEFLSHCPRGWVITSISEIAQVQPKNELSDNTDVGFVEMSSISSNHDGSHEQETRRWLKVKKGYTHIKDGDIGLAKVTPCFENSKAAIFKGLENGFGAATTELYTARLFGNEIVQEFVLYHLKSAKFLSLGKSCMTGTSGLKRVPKDYFASYPLTLAPVPEQHRIVAKVDELMALCDTLEQQQEDSIQAHETLVEVLLEALSNAVDADAFQAAWGRISEYFDVLFTTDHSINKLKETILQLAIMGKLVPQDPSDEPASVLLEKITADKKKLQEETGDRRIKLASNPHRKSYPGDLPLGWEVQSFENLFLFIDYRGNTPPKTETGIPLITAKNIRMAALNREPREYISEQTFLKWMTRGSPRLGDIFFTTEAPLANVCLNDIKEPFALAQRVICLQPYSTMNTAYLIFALTSQTMQSMIDEQSTGMTARGIKASKLKPIAIPIPPLAEQHRIVAKVDELMGLCNQLKSSLQQAQETQILLTDAVVENAL